MGADRALKDYIIRTRQGTYRGDGPLPPSPESGGAHQVWSRPVWPWHAASGGGNTKSSAGAPGFANALHDFDRKSDVP